VDGCAALCQDDPVAGIEPYSLVIVTYNHADTVPACLRAVAALEPAPERLIVIDNASNDGSAGVAAAHAGRPPVEVIREDRNTGFAAAANLEVRYVYCPASPGVPYCAGDGSGAACPCTG